MTDETDGTDIGMMRTELCILAVVLVSLWAFRRCRTDEGGGE